MRLIVFNGSPRKEKSSTKILLDYFLKGFNYIEGSSHEAFYLRSVQDRKKHIEAFSQADYVIIGFPLYTDAMPSFVNEFFESLEPYCGKVSNLSVGYLVQSGFPEANHSRYMEKYLEKLTKRLGSKYLGTIIKGNANRIDEQPKFFVKPVFRNLFHLGRIFGETGEFDPNYLSRLAMPEQIKGFVLFITRLVLNTRLATKNWDKQLKANKAYDKRFDAPFSKK